MDLFLGVVRGWIEESETEVGELDSLIIFCSLNAVLSQVAENMPVGATEEGDPLIRHLCFWGDLDEFKGVVLVEGQEQPLLWELISWALRIAAPK
ncbi:hypothetical protein SSOG_02775 [Streptomyces himastatinicus ATCC 53653]|uniref:Uncharacterized protein n=1 Tax=Streptomyces himastatinicus ATCC 53653 TaxID=457427 RepID=D9WCY2_9ACTN|nr:hypothetical protein SSOG_02775 [Streptomyces himastatinicus ATCC 53653]